MSENSRLSEKSLPPVERITEGYVSKGGQNTHPTRITVRPPAPGPYAVAAKPTAVEPSKDSK